jgi:monoamine oxidase
MQHHCNVAIIGAGAAGIAAASYLRQSTPLSVEVLEGRDRLGGRAWTVDRSGLPIDLGCGWFHSADENDWMDIARQLNFEIDRTPPPWTKPASIGQLSTHDQAEFRQALNSLFRRLEALPDDAPDCAAAKLLAPETKWHNLLNAVSTYINGVELDRVSAMDFRRYHDTGINYRAKAGLGTLIRTYGATLNVQLKCSVKSIDYSGKIVRVVTELGTLTADAVIVTISTNLIAEQHLSFFPALPNKVEAASKLPLGLANKAFLRVKDPGALPQEVRVFGATDRTATGNYHIRPFGHPLIEAYFGGSFARELEQDSGAMAHNAIEELSGIFGYSIKAKLCAVATTAWAADPFARGSYSYAEIGHSHARRILAEPVNEVLFFAGEASSEADFSTAHGAYRTGVRAAREVMSALQKTAVSC